MPFTLTMPKLSPTMEGGTIVKWHKQVGDTVKEGDLLFEVATDKATVEHNALDGGYLQKILIPEGQDALVNQAVAIFTENQNESIEGYVPEGLKQKEAQAPKGKEASQTQEIKKETSPIAPSARIQPNFPIEPPLENYSFEFEGAPKERLAATPLAKKLAKEKGLDLDSVKGSGPDGRIMSRDLSLGQPNSPARFGSKGVPSAAPGSYEELKMTPMRKAIADKLQASKSFIPHFYLQQDIDAEPMITLREQLKNGGVKVTFNDFILRASALSLKEHPVLNRGLNAEESKIVQFKTIDIAVAVTLPDGLITPILRHVDYKDIGQISSEVRYLAGLAKEGQLKPHHYRGGSFTVSNLGMYGIHDFQAIINPPQVSILAVGGIRSCPVVKGDQVVPGKRMMLSLSSDHRVIDGADAARFMVTLQNFLENPTLLLL